MVAGAGNPRPSGYECLLGRSRGDSECCQMMLPSAEEVRFGSLVQLRAIALPTQTLRWATCGQNGERTILDMVRHF